MLGIARDSCYRILAGLGKQADADQLVLAAEPTELAQHDQSSTSLSAAPSELGYSQATDVTTWLSEVGLGESSLAGLLREAGVERLVELSQMTMDNFISIGVPDGLSEQLDTALVAVRRRFSVEMDGLDHMPVEPTFNIRRGMTNRRLTGAEL